MSVTLWCFVERAGGEMRRVPLSRFRAFWDGKAPLEPSAPGEVRALQVALVVEGRTVAAFVRAWPSRHRVTADGLNDVQHRDSGTRLAVATLDFTSTETVVSLGPSLAKRDFQQEHAWRPTEAQLQQVANVLNRASARPPVVAVTAEGLVPV